MKYAVAEILTDQNTIEFRPIIAPRDTLGTVLLPFCPAGTLFVRTFNTLTEAADFADINPRKAAELYAEAQSAADAEEARYTAFETNLRALESQERDRFNI